MKSSERKAYTRYLTERLDSGQSQNIVISTTADLITRKANELTHVKILDIGCFSGAMLNRIRNEIPEAIKGTVEFVGIDVDEEALALGRAKYEGILFVPGEVNSGLKDLGSFDITIMSNVIHEAIPENDEGDQTTEIAVSSVIRNVANLLNNGGNLVILDGLRPENDQDTVTVCFANDQSNSLFELFANKYRAFPIAFTRLADGNFRTRVKDLAAFLTKARYLNEDYWSIEASQVYQFFTADQFTRILQGCGMEIQRLEPQFFEQEHVNDIFSRIYPQIEIPAKNVLVVARKIT